MEIDLKTHIRKTNSAIIQLYKMWKAKEILLSTKLGILKAMLSQFCSMDMRLESAQRKFSRVCKPL
jgi:hypothetical protein